MSDQQAPHNGDTPAVAGPDQAPGTAQDLRPPEGDPNDPYEKRYHEVRNWADRVVTEKHQRAEELERQYAQAQQAQQWYEQALTAEDEATRREALENLGYEIPEEEDPEPAEYLDPYDELRNEITSVREQLSQREQAEQQAEQAALIREVTDERLAQYEGLSEQDQDMILAYAINALPPVREPGVPVPLPDIKAAVEHFQQWEGERQKQWAKTKRAPYVSPGGHPANEVPDPGHGQQARLNRAMQSLRNSLGDNE